MKFIRSERATGDKLIYTHSKPWGPAQNPTLGRSMYFVSFIDDFSRKTWVVPFKSKDKKLEKFKNKLSYRQGRR